MDHKLKIEPDSDPFFESSTSGFPDNYYHNLVAEEQVISEIELGLSEDSVKMNTNQTTFDLGNVRLWTKTTEEPATEWTLLTTSPIDLIVKGVNMYFIAHNDHNLPFLSTPGFHAFQPARKTARTRKIHYAYRVTKNTDISYNMEYFFLQQKPFQGHPPHPKFRLELTIPVPNNEQRLYWIFRDLNVVPFYINEGGGVFIPFHERGRPEGM